MDRVFSILSESLTDLLTSIYTKTSNPIVEEILKINKFVRDITWIEQSCSGSQLILDTLHAKLDDLITDECSMFSVRLGTDGELSYLPKGKDPVFTPNGNWAKQNRQTGKPAKLFKKLLKREFKTKEWEDFSNLFKAELCNCNQFELVSGEDIIKWYNCDNYYSCNSTLGNSCMRYSECCDFFDIYVDNAKMLITKRDGLLTGRAIIWEIDGVTIMDRIYTCFDYLVNCFIDYAKSQGWWIRANNSLLITGNAQCWYSPDDNYSKENNRVFDLKIKKLYNKFPYMDSFRYYDGDKTLSTYPGYSISLDSTDGYWDEDSDTIECSGCQHIFVCYDGEIPHNVHYSEYTDAYYCENCARYSYDFCDWLPIDMEMQSLYNNNGDLVEFPKEYVLECLRAVPNGCESRNDIVLVDGTYYMAYCPHIYWNETTSRYELKACDTI